MPAKLPDFDALYVISDLHMGGETGFQILHATDRLAGFIGRLATQPPGLQLALVLNGDIIDTLAEQQVSGYVAMLDAPKVVADIIDRPEFKPIWEALADFVAADGRTLVIVIGNHDIELALPAVQRLLVERLTRGQPERRARLEFSTTGGGYPCTVGGARVFCTHGNETDEWNINRYEDIARLGRRVNLGQALPEWHPNPGTRLVKDVLNEVKRRYAWIDLLKPENSAAFGTLLALDPGRLSKLPELIAIFPKQGDIDARDQRLGGAAPNTGTLAAQGMDQLLGPNLRALQQQASQASRARADEMLLAAEKALDTAAGGEPETDETLGTAGLLRDRLFGWITRVPKEEALRRALLDWLKDDNSFDTTYGGDKADRQIIDSIGGGFQFIIAGHTHLARAVGLGGGCAYFNSGTWIRLVQFTRAILDSPENFKRVYAALEQGTLKSLEAQHLILDFTTAVRISRDAHGAVSGVLLQIHGNGRDAATDTPILPKA